MRRRSTSGKLRRAHRGVPRAPLLTREQRARWLRRGAVALLVVAGLVAGSMGVSRLEAQVNHELLGRHEQAKLTLLDLPDSVAELARPELYAAIQDLLVQDWTAESSCREMATRLATVGWVARVHFVRRTADARFEISARYRVPRAMVAHEGEFLLVDEEGVRLPGLYRYEPSWMLIQGVAHPAPQPGVRWPGDDLRAALAVQTLLSEEPFRSQITGVIVENAGGRLEARRSHVELATDRPGGRIRWGSAPGREIEENSVEQKLRLLRANFLHQGRADAGHPIIDISTLPDRFTIPG